MADCLGIHFFERLANRLDLGLDARTHDSDGQLHFEIRHVLCRATLTAARHNPGTKTFYDWPRAAGKLPKVALVACLRKFLTVFNAMVKSNKRWHKSLLSR